MIQETLFKHCSSIVQALFKHCSSTVQHCSSIVQAHLSQILKNLNCIHYTVLKQEFQNPSCLIKTKISYCSLPYLLI